MATYPGTVKVFTTKADQVDTLLAAHVNVLQDEVTAIETTLGTNPQGNVATVALRLSALETGSVSLTADNAVSGNKTFAGLTTFTGNTRASATGTLGTIAATTHPFQVGVDGAANLAVDAARIQARNNGASADLLLNPYGGNAYVGAGKVWTQTNDGAASGLDADTVDGLDASAFALAGHKHPANFCQLTRSIVQGIPNNTWTTVVFNTQVVHYQDSGAVMYTMGDGRFYTPQLVGPALYYFGVRFSYEINSTFSRQVRFVDENDVVIDISADAANLTSKDYISLSGMYYFPGGIGKYLRVQTFQNTGGSLNILANGTTNPFAVTWAAVARGLA